MLVRLIPTFILCLVIARNVNTQGNIADSAEIVSPRFINYPDQLSAKTIKLGAQPDQYPPKSLRRYKKISRVVVYRVTKGKGRLVGVTEANIKNNNTADIFEISTGFCLNGIEKRIKSLKEVMGAHAIRYIYMLCEVTYNDGSRQTISFDEASFGNIKMGNKLYSNSKTLESWILFCK